MPVHDLFSYRKRVAEGNVPDVFTYDELSSELRVQIVHIWRRAIGEGNDSAWTWIHDLVAEEHGRLELADGYGAEERCKSFLLLTSSVETHLDLVEASFQFVERIVPQIDDWELREMGIRQKPTEAIADLNERFRRAGVGYRFEDGQIFRVDSELVHSEVVRPALGFLNQPGFEGPREEFLRAHVCYRGGDTKGTVTNANNALKSTLKSICDQRGWKYDPGVTASRLVKIVRANGLLPDYLENSFDQLAAAISSGLPKVRNEVAAHGQGPTPRETPEYVAAFALHLAAAKILFLVEAHQAMT